ncbi:MAG: V-type ATP synthase subunit C [Promethearchaeota archaeon]|nr:MAG: V-type ATP synthase subunit C [Candidatus Lokiarchaeota archaeon]
MDPSELEGLVDIDDIREFINKIKPYYPDLNLQKYTIEEIEKKLYNIYIKLIGRIISFSPENMRNFLKDFLMKFEILNLKQIILGSIIGMGIEEKRENVNFLVHKYLENEDFMRELVKISSLDEIRLKLRGTRYYKAVREGILYFKNNNEIFVLESFLDQLYYKNLVKERKTLNKYEEEMISLFTRYITEIYNINMIYRGIINKIDKKLLSQFLVHSFLFLDSDALNLLIEKNTIEHFFNQLNTRLKTEDKIKIFYKELSNEMEHPIWELERIYQKFYFNEFKLEIDKIDYSTIYRIFEVLIKKEKEIKFEIVPNAIRIIHKKFQIFNK